MRQGEKVVVKLEAYLKSQLNKVVGKAKDTKSSPKRKILKEKKNSR